VKNDQKRTDKQNISEIKSNKNAKIHAWRRGMRITAKQANGSSGRPMGTDRGKFLVSTWSLDSKYSCGDTDSVMVGLAVEAPLGVVGKGKFSRVAISTTSLSASKSTWDRDLSDGDGNNDGGHAGFGGPKKLVMAPGLSFLASSAFSLRALPVWWLRRFASPPLIEREHTSQYRVSIFYKQKVLSATWAHSTWSESGPLQHRLIDAIEDESKARGRRQWESGHFGTS
jgi:hypothetical protein